MAEQIFTEDIRTWNGLEHFYLQDLCVITKYIRYIIPLKRTEDYGT